MAVVNAKPIEELSPNCSLCPGRSVTGGEPDPNRGCLVCGFLTLSRRAFTGDFESSMIQPRVTLFSDVP